MLESEARKFLNGLALASFAGTQRRDGRRNLSPDFRSYWTERHEQALGIFHDHRHSLATRSMADLLAKLTLSVATVKPGMQPNYYQYTDSHLLDWYFSPDLSTLPDLKSRAICGLYFLLRDLLQFEARSLGGFEADSQECFDRERVHSRIDLIQEAVEACVKASIDVAGSAAEPEYEIPKALNLEELTTQTSRLSLLIHFTCFPLTKLHDEVLFIRTLHGSELCFFGIRICLIGAIESLKVGELSMAAQELGNATDFGVMLYRLLKVLTAMPVDHFAQFRDLTSKASALQSVNYHLMDIFFRGLNTGKAEHFRRVEQLKSLLQYGHPAFVDLGKALAARQNAELESSGVMEAARRLDRQLLTWRGLHLSFALKYIPSGVPGTGGTEGAMYLQKHRQIGLFADTETDYDVVREIFPDDPHLPDQLRLKSSISVAPAEHFFTP